MKYIATCFIVVIYTDGDYRVCVVGAESVLCGGRVRCTGDLFYCGYIQMVTIVCVWWGRRVCCVEDV